MAMKEKANTPKGRRFILTDEGRNMLDTLKLRSDRGVIVGGDWSVLRVVFDGYATKSAPYSIDANWANIEEKA